jgi:hypothetical protein
MAAGGDKLARERRGLSMKETFVADRGLCLFEPDMLLPAQFFLNLKHRAQADGQRRLMVAVLADAIECFQKYIGISDGRGRQLGTEAERWLLSDDGSWPFSFVNICEVLDIHPPFLRGGLLKWKAQQMMQPRPPSNRSARGAVRTINRHNRMSQSGPVHTSSGT